MARKITGQAGLVLASSQPNLGVDGNVFFDTSAFTIELGTNLSTLLVDGVNNVTLAGAGSTITSAAGTPFADVEAGDEIVITGSLADDGTYTVLSSTDTVITITETFSATDDTPASLDIQINYQGVSLVALYSFIMTQWATGNFEKYKFPIESLTDAQFEVKNGWDFANDTTRYLIRDGGWTLLDPTEATTDIEEVWMNIQTLGSFDASTDQAYYIHSVDGTPINFELPGEVNQAVKIYDVGGSDYRLTSNSEFIVYLRIQGKTYASYNLNVEQAKSSLKNISYSLPLSNATDLDIDASDAYISFDVSPTDVNITRGTKTIASATTTFNTIFTQGDKIVVSGSANGNDGTYTIDTVNANDVVVVENIPGSADDVAQTIQLTSIHQSMSITWGANQQDFGEGNRDFGILIDANNGTLQEIYEFVQWSLRETGDIDDGAGNETGKISDEMLVFVGPTLKTKLTSDGGVYIQNFLEADTNSLVFVDDLGQERTYPFVAAGTINFNDNLVADAADAKYWMYFTTNPAGDFNTSTAVIVNDNDDANIKGDLTGGVSFKTFTFDYENNEQGGRTKNTEAPITLVAIGSNNAQYVSANETLTKSTLMSFTLTAAKERNYVS